MRALALVAPLLLLLPSCKDKDKQSRDATATAANPRKFNDAGPQRRKSTRGHPPRIFARGSTNGRVVAQDANHVYWAERHDKKGRIVSGHKATGERKSLAEGLGTVREIQIAGVHLYASVLVTPGSKTDEQTTGVIRIPLAGGKPEVIFPKAGRLGVSPNQVALLFSGNSKNPGRLLLLDASGKTTKTHTFSGGVGRADLLIDDGTLFWLGDRRVIKDGGKVRVGLIGSLAPRAPAPIELEADFASPGPHLKLYQGHLYFTAKDPNATQRLFRIATGGGAVTPVGPSAWEITRFAIDDTGIYASAHKEGWRIVRINGDDVTVLSMPKVPVISDLLIDDQHVYWGDSGKIWRVPKQQKPKKDQGPK